MIPDNYIPQGSNSPERSSGGTNGPNNNDPQKIFDRTNPDEEKDNHADRVNVGDPVNVTTGSLIYNHVDLPMLGGEGLPLGIERFYTSANHNKSSPLGPGWSHTYNMRFFKGTDWLRAYGGRMPLEAAPALVAAQIGFDLFDIASIPHQRFTMDVIIAQWLTTKITGNAATLVESDGGVAVHVLVSDGAYQPPTGRSNLKTVSVAGNGSATLIWENGRRIDFNTNGRPTVLEDANGNQTSLSYNGQGRLSQVTDAIGRSLSFSYDDQGRLNQVTDPNGRIFSYNYDGQGNLQTYTDPLGGITTYGYDSAHRITTIKDPLNTTFVTNQYDALGQVSSQLNGRGFQTQLLYGGYRTTVTNTLGQRTIYAYDDRNRLQDIENALGHHRSANYDAAGHVISFTNGLSQSNSFSYDAWGRLLTTTNRLSHTTTWGYDSQGNPSSFTDQGGKTWQFSYNSQHNLISITNPLGGNATYTYANQGQLIQAQDATGRSASYSYDLHGNLKCITNALGESCWGYDLLGRPTSFTDGTDHETQYSYDVLDNLLQVTDPLGHSTQYNYDANSNLTSIVDANNHSTTFGYDAQFNLVSVTDPRGYVTSYEYDGLDSLVRITDANNHQTIYGRDELGRLTGITNPLGQTVIFSYDAADRLTAFGRADGSSIGYQRDPMARITKIDYPSGSDINYGYDAVGNLTSATSGSWSANYSFNDMNQLKTISDNSRNLTVNYDYDLAGRRTRLYVNRGATPVYDLAYIYNAAAHLSQLADQLRNPADTISLSYDANGHLTQLVNSGGAKTNYTYDDAGQLITINNQDNEANDVATYDYSYDPVGNPTTVDETTPAGSFTTNYTYDASNQLTQESYPRYNITFVYDDVGNLTNRTDALGTVNYTYNNANQLLSRGSETFSYNVHGNRSTWQNAKGTHIFNYNFENALTSLTLPDSTSLSFTQDGFGRRLTMQSPAGTRGFLHDGLNILFTGNGNLSQISDSYMHAGNRLVARNTEQLGSTLVRSDGFGNVRQLADQNGRFFTGNPHFEGFGQAAHTAGIAPNLSGYLGERGVLTQNDLPGWPGILTSYREFDPLGPGFSTIDPLPGDLGQPLTLRNQGYGLNNPFTAPDPTGRRPEREKDKVDDLETPEHGRSEFGGGGTPKKTGTNTTDPAMLQLQAETGQVENHKNRVGSSTRLIQASIVEPGQVMFDASPAGPSPPKIPALRGASPTSFQNLPPGMISYFPTGGKYSLGGQAISAQSDLPQWQPVADHGTTHALACASTNRLLAGAFQSGLFSSLDPTHYNWTNEYAANIGEITLTGSNTHYAGTWYNGILKSTDGGNTWTPINNGLTANDVYAVAINPSSSNQIFAGTEMGLFVSNNGGTTWGRAGGTLPGRIVTELDYSSSVLLVVTELGLYRSSNGGSSWQSPATDLPSVRINVLLANQANNTVYAGTVLGLYRSTDNGNTWATFGTGLNNVDIHALGTDPTNANYMAAGTTTGLYISTDGGSTWAVDTNSGLTGLASQVGALAFCSNGGNSTLYLGNGIGVYALLTPTAPVKLTVTGLSEGGTQKTYNFTASVSPFTATLPMTYTWQATDWSPTIRTGSISNVIPLIWSGPGTKTITATARNGVGLPVTATYTIMISQAVIPSDTQTYLPIILRKK